MEDMGLNRIKLYGSNSTELIPLQLTQCNLPNAFYSMQRTQYNLPQCCETYPNQAQLNQAQLNQAQLNPTQPNSTKLNQTKLNPSHPNPTNPNPTTSTTCPQS